MMKRYFPVFSVLFIITFLLSCAGPSVVSVRVQKPAAIHLPGIRKIAIVDFQGQERSGNQIATLIQSDLMKTKYYDILERDKLKRILEEQNLAMSGVVDQETAVEVGRLLGVDAMVFGEVTLYQVERDERGVEKVERKEGTGRYEWVEEKNIFTGKKRKVKREIMKTVLVDQHYRIRRGTVAINFRVVGVETAQLLAAHSDSRSYNSGKVIEGSRETLKAKGEILSDLSKKICSDFVHLIAPYFANVKRTLERGKGSIDVGVKYAESDLWSEALGAWENAVIEMPNEPAAYYNLGLAHEVLGDLNRAEELYERAMKMKQKKLYMEAMRRIRQAKKEHEELRKQLMEREENDS
jgi:curli biogenesis system outer membrane secretion channel CsgG